MARILLLDSDERAQRALQGILARGNHRLVTLPEISAVWDFLHRNPATDLFISELRIGNNDSLPLLQRLKADPHLRYLPIVIYARQADRHAVRQAIELRVQNLLIKPFHDDDIFAELDKALAHPWCDQLFEAEKAFGHLMDLAPDQLRERLAEARDDLLVSLPAIQHLVATENFWELAQTLTALRKTAEEAGAWVTLKAIDQIESHAQARRWARCAEDLTSLHFSASLIQTHLDPTSGAPDFLESASGGPDSFRAERERYLLAATQGQGPAVPPGRLHQRLADLPGCPVIASTAAAFQMIANGHPSCIKPLMDLVARDPGLSVQILVAANRAHPEKDDFNRIEDARLAVVQLGETALEKLATQLLVTPETVWQQSGGFTWPAYWTFQRGVARIAQLICRDLEFNSLESLARTAGQLHDLGNLALAHLFPAVFQAVLEYARLKRRPLREVEKLFLGVTTPEIGGHFAETHQLSRRLARVIRWIDEPSAAGEDRVLTAIVSLARELCRHNQVGVSTDPLVEHTLALETTPAWQILREGLYPSFNFGKFERQVHTYCAQIRHEFSGQRSGSVADLFAHSAL